MSRIFGPKSRQPTLSVTLPSFEPPTHSTHSPPCSERLFGWPPAPLPPKPPLPARLMPPPPSAPGIWQRLAGRLGRLWRKTALWLAFSAMALGGCASSQPSAIPTVIRTPPPTVPPTLLRCAPEPMAPDPATSTQRDVAAFLFDLAEAGQDCRRKLGVTRRLLDTYARETDR